MAYQFRTLGYWLQQIGFVDLFLPFILIFAVVYGILSRMQLFDNRNLNTAISVVLALLVVIPHVTGTYPPNADVVQIINDAIPNVGVVLVAVLLLFIMIGAWGVNWAGATAGWVRNIAVALSVVAILYIFGSSAGWFRYPPYWLSWLVHPDTAMIVVGVLVCGLIIYAIRASVNNPPNPGGP
ncbi:hypothetical protein KY330_03050 [Candidatus Woesearchaeota archaeon]|nr:hypothetical protein [Candidatus Woesearchaeota archaeon]